MNLFFRKYQGTGNDFVLIDNRDQHLEQTLHPEQVHHLCDRRFGIGADGLMLLSTSTVADFRMIYYNADGHESTFCGNGARCITAFARHCGIMRDTYQFEAADGLHIARFVSAGVELQMAPPYGYREISGTDVWLHTGSPHLVRFMERPLAGLDIVPEGRALRYSEAFQPGGTNVNFVEERGAYTLLVRTYERGVEDETLSCGTGVTAAAYAWLLRHRETGAHPVVAVETPGGHLQVGVYDWQRPSEAVWLTGPAEAVFEGMIEL